MKYCVPHSVAIRHTPVCIEGIYWQVHSQYNQWHYTIAGRTYPKPLPADMSQDNLYMPSDSIPDFEAYSYCWRNVSRPTYGYHPICDRWHPYKPGLSTPVHSGKWCGSSPDLFPTDSRMIRTGHAVPTDGSGNTRASPRSQNVSLYAYQVCARYRHSVLNKAPMHAMMQYHGYCPKKAKEKQLLHSKGS